MIATGAGSRVDPDVYCKSPMLAGSGQGIEASGLEDAIEDDDSSVTEVPNFPQLIRSTPSNRSDASRSSDLDISSPAITLYAAVDVALDNPSDVFGVSAWDLGLAYDMGDLSLGFATDSSSDWGLSASMAIAGFGVSTTFGSSGASAHTKSGITYSVGASTALNGFKLALGFDQDLEPTVGVSYYLGGLVLSAGYDAGDEGGALGAKLSF